MTFPIAPLNASNTNIGLGTSNDAPTENLKPIKLFGCTVVDFNVSADWSSQGGNLSCRLIEDTSEPTPYTNNWNDPSSDSDPPNNRPDRLIVPVLGTPTLFELKDIYNNVVFQYIGIVDSFSRSASNSKTYNVTLSSPMKVLEATNVILDGYTGLGSSIEGLGNLAGLFPTDYGHNNSLMNVLEEGPGVYHWWNISNLINVFGILENDDLKYRVPTVFSKSGKALQYGGYGFSGRNKDGIPLLKLMWALHYGINHAPLIADGRRQKTHGGNLLYGRHNYDVPNSKPPVLIEAKPYYYHFDAIHFYRQIESKLGPQFRVEGHNKSLKDIISALCEEANLEFYTYIDIYKTEGLGPNSRPIGSPTLQEIDPEWGFPARLNWPKWNNTKFYAKTTKWQATVNQKEFGNNEYQMGQYGGTIRIQTIDRNSFVNKKSPFNNIAYQLIGLEVPDIHEEKWAVSHQSGIHPGRRNVNDPRYGMYSPGRFADPLDGIGIEVPIDGFDVLNSYPGTESIASGGAFPVDPTGEGGVNVFYDPDQFANLKIKSSDVSIKLNDVTSMKVLTGGYQSRIVSVPGNMLRHYWGDIIVPGADPRDPSILNPETDALGLNELSTRKIPVVTPVLDPRDVDDFILIDLKTTFGNLNIPGVFSDGIYAASMLEIRCAMRSESSWKAFFYKYKYGKFRRIKDYFFPNCKSPSMGMLSDTPPESGDFGTLCNDVEDTKSEWQKATEDLNACEGLGYVGLSNYLGLGNTIALNDSKQDSVEESLDSDGEPKEKPYSSGASGTDAGTGAFGLGLNISCAAAEFAIKKNILPPIHEKLKEIGDTHYGKSWYAPVPYAQTIQDLDGNNLVGDFKRSWELTDSAYVEPSEYYTREVPQSNSFVSDGKVSAFVNYDNNFLKSQGDYDKNYLQEITSLGSQDTQVFNFSEYNMDQLCSTKYSSFSHFGVRTDGSTYPVYGANPKREVIHAAPQGMTSQYSFLPFAYDRLYNRAVLPFSNLITGQTKRWVNTKSESGVAPVNEGQEETDYAKDSPENNKTSVSSTEEAPCPGEDANQLPDASGYFQYGVKNNIPSITHASWLSAVVPALQSLDYKDNGRFCFPFVKFTTSRVFLPVPAPGKGGGLGNMPSMDGFNAFVGAEREGGACASGVVAPQGRRQHMITEDSLISILNPFQACVTPRSFHYPQVSTRYVYGPWMTSLKSIFFRGKIEYEQDDSLVPENYLIPTNFGKFGNFEMKQISGFTGMNLAAQGRVNSIDNFELFALEEGSITFPGGPGIKRVGDGIYGIPQVTDLKISVSSDRIETTYSFKTIAPKFGKNNRDLEKKLTKISNDIKKLKLR